MKCFPLLVAALVVAACGSTTTTIASVGVVHPKPGLQEIRQESYVENHTTTTQKASRSLSTPRTSQPRRIPSTSVVPAPTPTTAPLVTGEHTQVGRASWYQTFNGTCAHKTLPKGTVLSVTNLTNGRSTSCRVADRGPYLAGRIVDLDKEVFSQIAPAGSGTAYVRIDW